MPPRIVFAEGERVGRLTAIRFDTIVDGYSKYWFKCDCGTVKSIYARFVKSGGAKSCGCLAQESRLRNARNPSHVRHGHRRRSDTTTEYASWCGMKARCGNPNNPNYQNYGGRGVRVCKEWLESFETFFRDMGPRPSGHSIDRINNDGNYQPDNCRWATSLQQNNNRRPAKPRKAG